MLTQQELSDQLEIQQLHQRYFRAMDTWDYALLDSVFTPDAVVRYDALAGADTTYGDMLPRFESFNRHFCFMQHLGGQLLVELAGNTATSTQNLRALHVQATHDGRENRWVIYGFYRDELVRTGAGWRIRRRLFKGMRSEGELLPFDRVKRFDAPPWL